MANLGTEYSKTHVMEGLANAGAFLQSVQKAKAQRRTRELRQGLMQIAASGGTSQDMAKYLADNQPQQASGPLQGIFSMINPFTDVGEPSTLLEGSVSDYILKGQFAREARNEGDYLTEYQSRSLGQRETEHADTLADRDIRYKKDDQRYWLNCADQIQRQLDDFSTKDTRPGSARYSEYKDLKKKLDRATDWLTQNAPGGVPTVTPKGPTPRTKPLIEGEIAGVGNKAPTEKTFTRRRDRTVLSEEENVADKPKPVVPETEPLSDEAVALMEMTAGWKKAINASDATEFAEQWVGADSPEIQEWEKAIGLMAQMAELGGPDVNRARAAPPPVSPSQSFLDRLLSANEMTLGDHEGLGPMGPGDLPSAGRTGKRPANEVTEEIKERIRELGGDESDIADLERIFATGDKETIRKALERLK